jgi:phage tail sheath protein FI
MSEKIISPGVFQNESDQSLVQAGIQGAATAIVGPTVLGQPLVPTYVTSYSEFQSKYGTTFKSGSYYYEYLTSIAAREFFQNGGQSLLVTRVISGSASVSTYASASVLNFSSSLQATASVSSFTLETLTWGDIMNNAQSASLSGGALASGSATNVRWEVTNVNTGSGVFTLAIRRGDDNTTNPNYIETWPNLSLDPALPNYISRVLGDQKPVYTVDSSGQPYINLQGSFANASQYVRVASVATPQVDSIDNNGNYKASTYGLLLPATGSGSIGGAFQGGKPATTTVQLMNEYITSTNMEGYAVADYNTAFALLTNKDEYRFNVLIAPAVGLDSAAATTLISVAEGRGDAFAPIHTGIYGTTITTATQTAAGQSSNYSATYFPWIQLYNSNLGKNVWATPTTVMGGVLAFNDQVGAEWFAPAGLNRGGVPSVLRAERKLSQADRDTLYSANVNPLATFPGEGVVVFGQKTLQRRATSLDRVNVRRLLISLKDFIGQVGNNLVFEQNTNATRNRFLAQVNPFLESVVQRQGLYAYKVVMDDTNNTPDVIDRNQLVGQIYIQPTKTAEFIILNFNVLPTGATFPA